MNTSSTFSSGIREQKMASNVAPLTPSRKKSLNGSTTPGNGKKRVSPGGQTYAVGSRVEAKDFSGHWNSATVSEVDWDEREILIHFDKYEEWMPMDSQRVRPYKEPDASSLCPANLNLSRMSGMNGRYYPEPKPAERRFKVGEEVMATWTNNRKYPATIASHQPNDRYEVLFYDGFAKSVRGSKISKMKDSDALSKHSMSHLNHKMPPTQGNHHQTQPQFKSHQQPVHPNQLKNQHPYGSLNGANSVHQPKTSQLMGQSQLEKQLLQPPSIPTATHYGSYGSSVNGLLPIDESIGTKEQRRERKRKHNVKELFSTKRPRGEKVAKVRPEKKSAHSLQNGSHSASMSNTNVQSPVNGLLLGVDPMFPANPMKVEGIPSASIPQNAKDNSSDIADAEIKKKRKRMKKKQDGFASDASESLSQKRIKASSSDDDECSIQWTNGEPQGEAAYVIESAEGLRKSIIVDDRRLPSGWSKHAIRRQGGTSAGKWDVFLVSCDQEPFEQSGNQSPWKGADGILSASASSSPVTVQSSSYFYSKKKKSRGADKSGAALLKLESGKPPSPPMEHLRREELINCTCGFTEEDGLMIQCDLCLCWQHGLCNQIENIEDVPQKYVCQICQNPIRERKSRHFIHDQDWLKEGSLPSLSFTSKDHEKVQQREETLKKSHDLCALLLLTQKVIHSLRVKVHIAEQKDHPKLYLWANSWQTESMGCPTPPSSPTQALDQKPDHFDAPRIPQPEAPIDPSECRLKLLDHIEHYQSLIDSRLTTLEQMIDELERDDPSLLDSKASESGLILKKGSEQDEAGQTEGEGTIDFLPQTKETVQMILRDLLNLRKISMFC